MPEVTPPREDHRDLVFIGGGDRLIVPAASSRLDNRRDARRGCLIDSIAKWKEGVRGANSTLAASLRLAGRDHRAIDSAHLPRANARDHPVLAKYDRVRFYMFANNPGE